MVKDMKSSIDKGPLSSTSGKLFLSANFNRFKIDTPGPGTYVSLSDFGVKMFLSPRERLNTSHGGSDLRQRAKLNSIKRVPANQGFQNTST